MNQTPPPDFSSFNSGQPTPQPSTFMPAPRRALPIPWVTYVMMGICVIVYIGQVLTQNLFGIDLLGLYGEKINAAIVAGELWRLVTPIWLHASILHIGFNMYALFIFGPGLERQYGHERYLLLYLLSGIAGNVFSFLFTAAASLGASTSIFGLIAAEGVFIYQNRELMGNRFRAAMSNIVFVVVINLFLGISTPGIDIWGHIGGLIGGFAFAWAASPVLEPQMVDGHVQLMDKRSKTQARLLAVGILVFLMALTYFGITRQS
jgi:rhomboid protease GluP